jgi:hypothetical protein
MQCNKLILNHLCAKRQTNVQISKKGLDRGSVECRIQIVAVQHSLGSGVIALKIATFLR